MSKKAKIKPASRSVNKTTEKQSSKSTDTGDNILTFNRENYKLLFIGLALIILGFLLMIGGGSSDPDVFNEEVFSFRRLTLAPLLVLAGYVVEIFAIMKRPKSQD